MFIEDVIRQFEVLICFWCVLSIYILMMIILSNIKFSFWFSNVLDTVDSTSCNVYHQFNLTVKFMENMFFVPHCFKKVARVESVYSISFTVLRKVSGKPIFFFLSCLYKCSLHLVMYGYISIQVHCLKSVQIQSFFWSVFSRIQSVFGYVSRSGGILSLCFFVFSSSGFCLSKVLTLPIPYYPGIHCLWSRFSQKTTLVRSATLRFKESRYSNWSCLPIGFLPVDFGF